MKHIPVAVCLCLAVAPAAAQDVVVIGEVHDNPAHHHQQADLIAEFAPTAIVFEMITQAQADLLSEDIRRDPDKIEEVLDWQQSGWPDFALYEPVFLAAPSARIYGALVPGPGAAHLRDAALEAHFEELERLYALDQPLPQDQQAAREALQMAAHCDALPEAALPGMVAFQRLRDAALAEAAYRAKQETGGPVVVITGNGHARPDWGMPALLAERAPELDQLIIGQTEEGGALRGGFDRVIDAPAVERPDPCLAFRD